MPKVFRTYRECRDEEGKRVRVLDAKGQPIPLPRWRAIINEWTGKRKMVTLCKNRAEAQRQADTLQARQDDIRNGVVQPPTPARKAAGRPFAEVAAEYLAWGNTQGGRGGRPWSRGHAHMRKTHMDCGC